jgi:4-hydroxy-2-oxoheptanedioate aldolase
MNPNRLKRKIADGEAGLGVISPHRDAALVEVIGHLGFDFYIMDGEHGPVSAADAEHIARACEITGVTLLARVRSSDSKLILQFLDAGVMGIMMPGMRNARDLEDLVAAVKYPPVGSRGLGPIRAANYMLKPSQQEYVVLANSETLVLPQIEDVEALENLSAMVAVEGVDGFIIGPRDLAMSMGFIDGPKHPKVESAIDQIFRTVRAAGLIVGTVAATGSQARALAERGSQLILTSVVGLLSASSSAFIKEARSASVACK